MDSSTTEVRDDAATSIGVSNWHTISSEKKMELWERFEAEGRLGNDFREYLKQNGVQVREIWLKIRETKTMEQIEVKPEQKEALLADLLDAMARSMASHKEGLELHQQSLKAHQAEFAKAFKTAETHAEAITILRADQERLAALVNTQSKLVSELQSTMLGVLKHLGLGNAQPSIVN